MKGKAREPAAYRDLFAEGLSKSERTRIAIARAAIASYATVGAEQTNFDRVARECGVTRPLVQHYFGSREKLFVFVIRYIRSHAVAFFRERLRPGKNELAALLDVALDWVAEHPDQLRVWLLFQYGAAIDPELRALHTELTHEIHRHLSAVLIRAGGDVAEAINSARMIQYFLVGVLVSRVSEEKPAPEAEFRRQVIRRCRELAAG